MSHRRSTTLLLLYMVLLIATPTFAQPANDACVNAITIDPGTRYQETLDSAAATTAVDDPLQSCTTGGPNRNSHSVWYRFTAPATGILSVYTVNTVFPANPPTIVSVHTGACGTLGEVACYDSETPIASYLHTAVTNGTTYWIDVTNQAGSPGGAVKVDIYFDPDNPICPDDGGSLLKGSLGLVGLDAPDGNERLKINVRAFIHESLPNLVDTGFQIVAEDFDGGYAPVIEWSARTLAVPPGGPGSGCAAKDGWVALGSGYRYRNHSNAFPPACTPGSANGLTEIRVHRQSSDGRTVDVKVRASDTDVLHVPTIQYGSSRLRLAVTLESTIGASNADRCAHSFLPLECKANSKQTTVNCRVQ